ncbi:MAG TPA: MarR family transcriptional regulator [Candidatus Sumerlaeota bacterium]|nr:MAG: Transcriptional repressor MprA [candidate division BRC1 bacterium ADurb.BinA292]HOE96411.1 MarR family transcriptional regulator [Candidatus Sumerlaeota bacterium]HOR28744.1 MarR family transcriptional regulator [Candidatus Sumerlaeota bacterium]
MALEHELGYTEPIRNHLQRSLLAIVLTGSQLAKEADRLLRPFGLTEAQFNVLMLLKYQADENGSLNQTRLGRMLLVNRSNVTGLVDRMEEAGWVQRTAESGDRRVKLIGLTARGRKLVERAEEAYFQSIDRLMDGIPRAELERMESILELLRSRTQQRQA